MKTYDEINQAYLKLLRVKKQFGKDSEQYKKALKSYNKAFRSFTYSTLIFN
jgi:hypothetical protein